MRGMKKIISYNTVSATPAMWDPPKRESRELALSATPCGVEISYRWCFGFRFAEWDGLATEQAGHFSIQTFKTRSRGHASTAKAQYTASNSAKDKKEDSRRPFFHFFFLFLTPVTRHHSKLTPDLKGERVQRKEKRANGRSLFPLIFFSLPNALYLYTSNFGSQ